MEACATSATHPKNLTLAAERLRVLSETLLAGGWSEEAIKAREATPYNPDLANLETVELFVPDESLYSWNSDVYVIRRPSTLPATVDHLFLEVARTSNGETSCDCTFQLLKDAYSMTSLLKQLVGPLMKKFHPDFDDLPHRLRDHVKSHSHVLQCRLAELQNTYLKTRVQRESE